MLCQESVTTAMQSYRLFYFHVVSLFFFTFVSFSAKVDVLIKNNAELKEEVRELKETIRNLKRSEQQDFTEFSTESFKILENLEDMKDFNEKLKIEDEFARAVCILLSISILNKIQKLPDFIKAIKAKTIISIHLLCHKYSAYILF